MPIPINEPERIIFSDFFDLTDFFDRFGQNRMVSNLIKNLICTQCSKKAMRLKALRDNFSMFLICEAVNVNKLYILLNNVLAHSVQNFFYYAKIVFVSNKRFAILSS